MKGYPTAYGYMGWLNGKYHLFATEEEYAEIFVESLEEEDDDD